MITSLLILMMQPVAGNLDHDLLTCEESPQACAAAAVAVARVERDEACRQAETQAAMNHCAAEEFVVSDAELNALWPEVAAAMKALDREIDTEYDKQPGYFETLLESQRAWLKLRDAQCRFESFMARGGSMQPMLASSCMAEMTDSRVAQLRQLVATPFNQEQ